MAYTWHVMLLSGLYLGYIKIGRVTCRLQYQEHYNIVQDLQVNKYLNAFLRMGPTYTAEANDTKQYADCPLYITSSTPAFLFVHTH